MAELSTQWWAPVLHGQNSLNLTIAKKNYMIQLNPVLLQTWNRLGHSNHLTALLFNKLKTYHRVPPIQQQFSFLSMRNTALSSLQIFRAPSKIHIVKAFVKVSHKHLIFKTDTAGLAHRPFAGLAQRDATF